MALHGILVMGFCASMLTLAAAAQAPSQPPQTPKMLVIDGGETPHLIPEHELWRIGFHTLAHFGKEKVMDRLEAIGLSPSELSAVLSAANGEEARDRECVEAIRRRDAELREQGADIRTVYQGHYDVILECRQRTLTVKESLLSSLSPEGRDALVAWVESRRQKMKVRIPSHEADFFKLPR
jgi:hypothetical protein